MTDAPTIYVSNWASRRSPGHHGPGRAWTIMAKPRHFERGDGVVPALVPDVLDLGLVQSHRISVAEYRRRYMLGLEAQSGPLMASPRITRNVVPVADGDTLCCACSRDKAAAGECHRVWAAEALQAAGWRVVLDGVVMGGEA